MLGEGAKKTFWQGKNVIYTSPQFELDNPGGNFFLFGVLMFSSSVYQRGVVENFVSSFYLFIYEAHLDVDPFLF